MVLLTLSLEMADIYMTELAGAMKKIVHYIIFLFPETRKGQLEQWFSILDAYMFFLEYSLQVPQHSPESLT